MEVPGLRRARIEGCLTGLTGHTTGGGDQRRDRQESDPLVHDNGRLVPVGFKGAFSHSASYYGGYPGNSPENLPPLEACMSNEHAFWGP